LPAVLLDLALKVGDSDVACPEIGLFPAESLHHREQIVAGIR
jgi:hypothetical protein